MSYAYTAYNKSGAIERGRIDAESRHDAEQRLRDKGLFVQKLERSDGAHAERTTSVKLKGVPPGGPRCIKQLSQLLRQISILLTSGTTLADALAAAHKQVKSGPWEAVIGEVRRRVEEGQTLSEALCAFPRTFDAPTRSLVAAGESSGKMTEILTRLAEIKRRQHKARSAISGAMIYPALLITASLGVLVVMLTVVLPRFAGMFDSIDAELPATTQLMLTLSDTMRDHWILTIVGAGALAGGLVFWVRSASGAKMLDSASLHAPIMGPLRRSFASAQLARLLGMLLQSKVPMLEALELTGASMSSAAYRQLLEDAGEAASRGESVSSVLARSSLIPGSLIEAARSGERSGSLGPVLTTVATFLDEDNEVTIKSISSLIEPLILIILGSLVAFVAVSMFLPLFDLTASAPGVGQ